MPAELDNSAVEILEMRLDAVSPQEAVSRIIDSTDGGCVLTPNLQHLRAYHRSPAVRRAFQRCELVIPDGMPLIWASRVQGTPLPGRVAGSDLVWSLTQEAASRGRTVFLLGGSPGTADEAAAELCRRFPGLGVAGTHCPPLGFEHSPQEVQEIRTRIADTRPDLVYIGLPLAKQLLVMDSLRGTVPRAWQVGLGATFSFVCGDIRRAPFWVQRTGFEWLFRLGQEPRRLGRRYLVEGLPFFVGLMTSAAGRRISTEPARLAKGPVRRRPVPARRPASIHSTAGPRAARRRQLA
jgi:N-acetylglucosaminyldiphosphoundecaprenol N-acetyl-beta-D-mannosaminyltransferase